MYIYIFNIYIYIYIYIYIKESKTVRKNIFMMKKSLNP